MRLNPILKRELRVQSRSFGLPMTVLCLNLALLLLGLLGAFGIVSGMRRSAEQAYSAFLGVYGLVILLEFCLMLLVTPSLTAGSISGERQTKTFSLMLTTPMNPFEIVLGKLLASLYTVVVLLISCYPAMLLPLMYGGVSMLQTVGLMLLFLPVLFYLLSIGVFASSKGSSSTKSMALSYVITAGLTVGTLLIAVLAKPFSPEGGNVLSYLLFFNPLSPIAAVLSEQIGFDSFLPMLFSSLSLKDAGGAQQFFVPICVLSELSVSALLLLLSVYNITPKRKREEGFGRFSKTEG